MRQHRHQFSLRTGLQPQRFAGVDQGFNHATVLVNLDRVDKEIVAVITVGFTRALEGGVNRAQTMLQDLREAEQRRQALSLGFARFDQLGQVDARFRDVRIRANADMAQFVNVVIVITPPGNIVGT